jgi:hypothetical protein
MTGLGQSVFGFVIITVFNLTSSIEPNPNSESPDKSTNRKKVSVIFFSLLHRWVALFCCVLRLVLLLLLSKQRWHRRSRLQFP